MSAARVPALSVVVPSFNRRRSLEMVLAGLAAQRGVAPGMMEVRVVLDGSTDDSAAMLSRWEHDARLPGLWWELRPNAGQAAARDAGARATAAPILLFVDDDVVPEPDLVARHLAWHAAGERIAVLGDCEIVRADARSFYQQQVGAWWEGLYAARARPGRVPCYTDFCAGNVSLRRADYLASGGFDSAFRGYGGEDYELGYRLLTAGVRFVADRGARAAHHHRFTGYAGLLRTRYQEGRADVLLGQKHPALRAGLRLANPDAPDPRADPMARAALRSRGMRPLALRALEVRVRLSERLGDRERWAMRLGALSRYHYWRGVHDALGSWDAVDAFRREAVIPVQEVHVGRRGLAAVPPDFWVHGPSTLRVLADGEPVGDAWLPGPVMPPLRDALVDAIAARRSPLLLRWAEEHGAPVLPRAAHGALGGAA